MNETTRPWIMLDLDGVIARPALGWNVAISRRTDLPALPDAREAGPRNRRSARQNLHWLSHTLRYLGRRPLPEAAEGLAALSAVRRPVVVTGRSWLVESAVRRWLARYHLDRFIEDVQANNTNLRTAHFKLRIARQRDIEEQVDDDGSIAYFLARHGLRRVFLRDWPRNRGLPYPENVTIVSGLPEVAALLSRPEP